ncbi:MAG: T9SS type A sorting domain-containing protein [Bacteroidota bacterium]|jgi:hypothetical protein
MKRNAVLLCILAASTLCLGNIALSQTPPSGDLWPHRFFIGVGHVRPDLPAAAPLDTWPHFIQSVEGQTPGWNGLPVEDRLPLTRFTQLEDLGVDLTELTIHQDHLIPPPANPHNIVRELNAASLARSGAEPIDLCIFDFPMRAAAGAERVMLHPEHWEDFENRGSFTVSGNDLFRDYPDLNLRFDHQLGLTESDVDNCIRMNGAGTVSGLTPVRLHELSVHRRYLTVQGTNRDSTAGKYHLSIIMLADEDITPADDNAVLRVTLSARSILDTTNIVEHVFDVPGSAFRAGGTPITNQVIEYHLGMIELRLDSLNPDRRREFSIVDWREGTFPLQQVDIERTNPVGIPVTEIEAGLYYRFDVSLEYLGGTAGTIYVDAICFSHPAAYALFRDGDPHCLPVYSNYRTGFTERLGQMLFEDPAATPPTLHSRLRLIYGAEQDWDAGAWRSSKFVQDQIRQRTDGAVRLYSPTSAWSNPDRRTELMELYGNSASGYYFYPVHWEVPMKTEPMDEYYNTLYLAQTGAHWNMQFATDRYRGYATSRKAYGSFAPWIPYIQNHSNMFVTSDIAWDGDPLREPTAAEVRVQCNLALAYGADGIMLYQFSQVPIDPDEVDIAYWPETLQQWRDNPNHRDENMGSLGFLNRDNTPRTVDCNGEDKWDSTRATITQTRALGQFMIDEELDWQCGRSWYSPQRGTAESVVSVMTARQDATWPIDAEDSTIVETTEFLSSGAVRYVFVLNGRTDTLGHRHITVKLAGDVNQQWLVENVTTNDLWIVRPTKYIDRTTTANGFTDYFPPGSAALYRISPYVSGSVPFGDICFAHTLTITHGASVSISDMAVNLAAGASIVVEDSLILLDCAVNCCALENTAHIYIRDGGGMWIQGWGQSDYSSFVNRVPISVGPGSRLKVARTSFSGVPYLEAAISLLDGYAWTDNNAIDLTGGGRFVDLWGSSEILAQYDSVQGNNCCSTIGIHMSGGKTLIYRERFLDLSAGIWATNGAYVQGCDSASPQPGRNKFRVSDIGLYCENSELQFGARPWGSPGNWYASQNSFGVLDTSIGFHAYSSSGDIYAYANFWGYGSSTPLQTCAPRKIGSVFTAAALGTDPVPFIGGLGSSTLQKEQSIASAPPAGIRETVLQHLAGNAHASARSAIENFLLGGGGQTASVQDLGFLYRTIKKVDAQPLVASLLAVCINRQDLRSKLLAADILELEGDVGSALSVLNSYSFAGSDTLLRDAFVRKAILYPLSGQGGYIQGLAVVDSLKALVGMDSTLHSFIERYPILFSNLTQGLGRSIPKVKRTDYSDILLPSGIDVWPNYPNPFADITSFTFKLGEATHVRLAVFDAMGREVAVITDADHERGVHSVVLRSGTLPNGLYFYRLITDAGVIQRKMMLLR